MLQFYLQLLDTVTEKEKFRQLYETYHRLMHWEALRVLQDRHLAEDAVQESFLRIIKNFDKIGEILCPQTKRFVVIIVRNAARNLLVKENRLRSMQVCDMPGSADDETDQPASMWENLSSGFYETPDAVLHKEILQTAQSLPDWAADVLLLSAVHGCSVREVAIACGITTEAAKKRLQRARVLFRNKMKEGETR